MRAHPHHPSTNRATVYLRASRLRIVTLIAALFQCAALAFAADHSTPTTIDAGVGVVDITPAEPVTLAGSPSPKQASEIKTRLYIRALVLATGERRVAIVTLDTLKYPVDLATRARVKIEQLTGIPASHVIICSSHTHYGPLWSYYADQLTTPIAEAVAQAAGDLRPCTVGASLGRVEGVAECRRVIKEGHAWNRWQLPNPAEAAQYPAEGPSDPDFDVLALTGADGKFKAVVYNFACHAANTRAPLISADFPGEVDAFVHEHLKYPAPTFFLTGACGDVNPIYSVNRNLFAERLGGEILRCLGQLEPIAQPTLAIEFREFAMPGREHPEFNEAEVTRNWPGQLEHYRMAYESMKKREQPSYPYSITGIRIGQDFAIVTNANELFCSIGLEIKKQSPFRHTMTVEQTNGAHGYVPTEKAFAGGSYEAWFGEHSYLSTKAGEIIERESIDILNRLRQQP